MSLEITYWTCSANQNLAGAAITSETRTCSGTSAQSGITPDQADAISIVSTAANRFAYGANPAATASAGVSGHYIGEGERIWLDAVPGHRIAGITAA